MTFYFFGITVVDFIFFKIVAQVFVALEKINRLSVSQKNRIDIFLKGGRHTVPVVLDLFGKTSIRGRGIVAVPVKPFAIEEIILLAIGKGGIDRCHVGHPFIRGSHTRPNSRKHQNKK